MEAENRGGREGFIDRVRCRRMPNLRYLAAIGLLVFGTVSFYFAAVAFGVCGGGQTVVLSGLGILLVGSAVSVSGLLRTGTVVAILGAVVFAVGLFVSHGAPCGAVF